MNTASFVISAASLAIQFAEIGDAVFGLSNYLSNKGPSSALLALAMTHEFEQTKRLERVLRVKGKFGLEGCLLDEMDGATRTLVLAMFRQLSEVWREYMQLRDKYALKDDPADLERGCRNDSSGVIALVIEPSGWADNDKLERLIAATSSWNMRLERTVKTFQWLRTASPSPMATISQLGEIAGDADAEQLGWVEVARLKQLVLAMTSPGVDREALPIPKNLDMGQESDPAITLFGPRTEGVVEGRVNRESVLIEFRRYTRPVKGQVPDDAMRIRVEQLTALLKLPKDPGFRLAPARGYYQDDKNGQFGIVFDVRALTGRPQTRRTTLQKLLDGERPSLGSRLKLSYVLAQSLSHLQSISWVHQGIRSENILFMTKSDVDSEIPYHLPWIFGYGNSRPESAVSHQVYDDDPVRNLYRHPDRWGSAPLQSFNKLHDIYSLGVVLLEIANWKPVKKLVRSELTTSKVRAIDVKTNLLDLAKSKGVQDLMGERFCIIVHQCLQGEASAFKVDAARDDKEDSMLQEAFKMEVVAVLEKAAQSIAI